MEIDSSVPLSNLYSLTFALDKIAQLKNWLHFSYLRNEFDFWNVYGIMNTPGLLQSK